MTEKKKRQPSATTLKVRAFAKWQRAKDDLARRLAAQSAAENKHAEMVVEAERTLGEAAQDYYELTGEKLPE